MQFLSPYDSPLGGIFLVNLDAYVFDPFLTRILSLILGNWQLGKQISGRVFSKLGIPYFKSKRKVSTFF